MGTTRSYGVPYYCYRGPIRYILYIFEKHNRCIDERRVVASGPVQVVVVVIVGREHILLIYKYNIIRTQPPPPPGPDECCRRTRKMAVHIKHR